MKILALGDIHGRRIWKQIIDQEQPDKVIFIGDYFDAYQKISTDNQLKNFDNIIKLKKQNKDNVVLLIGNHDYQYFNGVTEQYSGYQSRRRYDIQFRLEENKDLLQICHIDGKFLFTHAGLTQTWFDENFPKDLKFNEENLNLLFKTKLKPFGFQIRPGCDIYGNNFYQSPIWVRPESLILDMIKGYTQIVGHTTQIDKIKIGYWGKDIILIDTLKIGQYLIIEDNIPKIGEWINPMSKI